MKLLIWRLAVVAACRTDCAAGGPGGTRPARSSVECLVHREGELPGITGGDADIAECTLEIPLVEQIRHLEGGIPGVSRVVEAGIHGGVAGHDEFVRFGGGRQEPDALRAVDYA